jgi:protein-disulfide isomerase
VWLGAGAALLVVVALVVISLVSSGGSGGGGTPSAAGPPAAPAAPPAATRVPGDPFALGRPDAPVAIVEWADFQCPYCAQYTTETEPALIAQYVNTGKVRLEWRDFPFLGPESTKAAVAARAAGRQGRFWQYHDALYAEQHPENSGAVTDAYLVGLAGRLKLDTARFTADMADRALAAQVSADKADGTRRGVNGTPAFVVDGELVSGAQPLADFQKAIDAALARRPATR